MSNITESTRTPLDINMSNITESTRTPLDINMLKPFVIKAVNENFSEVLNIDTLKINKTEISKYFFLVIDFKNKINTKYYLRINYNATFGFKNLNYGSVESGYNPHFFMNYGQLIKAIRLGIKQIQEDKNIKANYNINSMNEENNKEGSYMSNITESTRTPLDINMSNITESTRTPLDINMLKPFVIKAVNENFSEVLNIDTLKINKTEISKYFFLVIDFKNKINTKYYLRINYNATFGFKNLNYGSVESGYNPHFFMNYGQLIKAIRLGIKQIQEDKNIKANYNINSMNEENKKIITGGNMNKYLKYKKKYLNLKYGGII